jgi:hypothetical protein
VEGNGSQGDRLGQSLCAGGDHLRGRDAAVQVTGNNEPVQMQGAEAYILSNTCSYIRTCWQLQLDGKYDFLDGYVTSHMCDQDMRLSEVWAYYKKLPYMDIIYAPRKRERRRSSYTWPISRASGPGSRSTSSAGFPRSTSRTRSASTTGVAS